MELNKDEEVNQFCVGLVHLVSASTKPESVHKNTDAVKMKMQVLSGGDGSPNLEANRSKTTST